MPKLLDDVRSSIRELAHRAGITENRAFAAWYAITFYNIDEDDALEAAAADGGNDQGIDIAFCDDINEEIVILQAYYPGSDNRATPKSKWDAITASIPFIQQPVNLIDIGRPDLAELLDNLKRDHPGYSFSLGLISLGGRSGAIESAKNASESAKAYPGVSLTCLFRDDIVDNYNRLIEAENGIPEDQLSFCGACFEDSGEYGRAWVGSVHASELRRLYDAYNDRLFAGNIRLYLGVRKGGINEQIRRTAEDTPGLFWALNNGITIVADSITPIKTEARDRSVTGEKFKLLRFSIVNGCQTTSSLVRLSGVPNAKVLARVIAAKAGLRSDIVRFNNSQNAIKIWTVRAVDDIQERIRRELKGAGYEYAPKQAGARQRRGDSIILLDKVTQYLAASDQDYLIQAINNKAELFDEPYQRIFKKDIRAERVLLAWIIGNLADERRQERVESVGKGKDANIGLLGVGSVLWIVFCTFKIIDSVNPQIASGYGITLDKVKTKEFKNALTKYVDTAIDMFYDSAIDTCNHEEYGSFKSTFRSSKFLAKVNSKVNNKLGRSSRPKLPSLKAVGKSAIA